VSKALWLAPVLIFASAGLVQAGPNEKPDKKPDKKADQRADQDEAVLAELDATLASQPPFQVVLNYACDELDVAGKLTLSYDPKAGRLYMRREGTSPKPIKTFALIEPGSATYWGAEGAQRFVYDLTPLLKGLHTLLNAVALSAGGEELSREAFRAKVGAQLQIGIGAHAMQTRPELRVGLGVSTLSRSTWTSELRDATKRELVVSPKEVKAKRAGGWSYVIDRKTGFFRSQRLELQSSTFTLEAGPLEPLEAFPKAEPPAVSTQELPVHIFVGMLRVFVKDSLVLGSVTAEGEALERVAKAYTLLAASASETRLHHLARSESRRYLQFRLEAGASVEALGRGVDAEAAQWSKHLAKAMGAIEREEERELETLRKAVLARVPADSPQAKALTAALSSERVRAARGKPASPKSHLEAVLATLR
jgi:hypothetical protein